MVSIRGQLEGGIPEPASRARATADALGGGGGSGLRSLWGPACPALGRWLLRERLVLVSGRSWCLSLPGPVGSPSLQPGLAHCPFPRQGFSPPTPPVPAPGPVTHLPWSLNFSVPSLEGSGNWQGHPHSPSPAEVPWPLTCSPPPLSLSFLLFNPDYPWLSLRSCSSALSGTLTWGLRTSLNPWGAGAGGRVQLRRGAEGSLQALGTELLRVEQTQGKPGRGQALR